MIDEPILVDKPASEYTPGERRVLIREARMYMFEVQKRFERLAELEEMLAKAEDHKDEPTKPA